MTFDEILTQVVALLQREGRVTYRALKRRFGLDDDYLEDLRGEIIKAFVVLNKTTEIKLKTEKQKQAFKDELSQYVKKHLAGHAYPREIEFIDKLPKTRSGKIMRRILKAKDLGLPIGDTSTLEEY